MSAADLRQFKLLHYTPTTVGENVNKEYKPFDDERYSMLVKSAHDKQYYNQKSINYDFKNYRGQQSNKRFVQLCDIEDH